MLTFIQMPRLAHLVAIIIATAVMKEPVQKLTITISIQQIISSLSDALQAPPPAARLSAVLPRRRGGALGGAGRLQ